MTNIYLPTFTGKKFDILNPRPEDICLLDIAQGLSREPRYNGHTRLECNTAEHSVRISYLCEHILGKTVGLLHDSSEAYMKDIPRPLKVLSEFSDYRVLEGELSNMILHKFMTPYEAVQGWEMVEYFDKVMPWVECNDGYVHPHPSIIPAMNGEQDDKFKRAVKEMRKVFKKMVPWGWDQKFARSAFIQRALELRLVDESIEGYRRNTKSLVLL